mgnify:CR=1 FL=1
MPNFTGKSGGGPHHMKKGYGTGKSPIMNLGFIKAETLKKNPDAKTMMVDGKEMPITKGGPKMKYGSPMDMYGKKQSIAKKYKSDAQRKAVHASKAEKK